MLKKRNSMGKKAIKQKSAKIIKKLTSLKEFKRSKTILGYASIRSETMTLDFIKRLLKNKRKKLVLPKVEGKRMVLSKIDDFAELKKGSFFNILEPRKIKKVKKVDLILVPGIAFDQTGHRIGYGKGYYDRLLKKTKAVKVGLAFELQLIDKVPNHPHDVPVDMVVSEKRVMRF